MVFVPRLESSAADGHSVVSLLLRSLACLLVLGLIYLVCLPIYNLLFHPLRRFPGPKLWAATRIPYTISELSGQSHKRVLELHKTYGPFVRVAPEILSISHPEAANDLKGHRKPGQEEHGKDPLNHTPNIHNIIGANREDHKRFRRALSRGFSVQAMLEQQSTIKKYVDQLFSKLHTMSAEQETVDMVAWFNYTTFDVIGDLAFGEPFGCLDNATYHTWVATIFLTLKQMAFLRNILRYPFGSKVTKLLIPEDLMRKSKEHSELSAMKARKRLATKVDRPDFVGKMLQAGDKKDEEMSFEELASNASILIIAGSETTATLLSAASYLLAKNPQALANLTEEVRSAFESEDEIDLVSTQNLKYMQAVLEESLRIFPPAAAGQPRKIARGGDVIAGEFIPESTIVELPQWATYHNPAYFSQAEDFIPERWLGDERFKNDVREVMQPFSVGPRNCIGRNLAYSEMRLIMARLVWNFDLKLQDDSQGWMEQSELYILWDKRPLNFLLTPRRRA